MLILLLGLFSCVERPRLHIDDGYSEFEGNCDDNNHNANPGAVELDSTELCMVDNDASIVDDMDCDGVLTVLTVDDCDGP